MGFLFAKLLAFLPFGNIFKGLSGKFILVAGAVLFIVFLVWQYKAKITDQVAGMFRQQQLEDTIVFQRQELTRLRGIEAERNSAIELAIKNNESLILIVDKTRREIRSDRFTPAPATPILKHTLQSISDYEKSQLPKVKESTGNSAIDAWRGLQKIVGGDND